MELFGFGIAEVAEMMQLRRVQIYYKPEDFVAVLRGHKKPHEVNKGWDTNACPHYEKHLQNKQKTSPKASSSGIDNVSRQMSAVSVSMAGSSAMSLPSGGCPVKKTSSQMSAISISLTGSSGSSSGGGYPVAHRGGDNTKMANPTEKSKNSSNKYWWRGLTRRFGGGSSKNKHHK